MFDQSIYFTIIVGFHQNFDHFLHQKKVLGHNFLQISLKNPTSYLLEAGSYGDFCEEGFLKTHL